MAIDPRAFVRGVRLTTTKWDRIKREFKVLDNAFTAVGFFSEDTNLEGVNIAQIAFFNEFGVPKNVGSRIPERSFMRAWADQNKRKINAFKLVLIRKVVDGKINAKRAIAMLGEFAQGEIKKFIIELSTPPNAPSTIAHKGSSNPLIDTGTMVGAVNHKEFFTKASLPK